MDTFILTAKQLNILKSRLPSKAISQICDKTGLSRSYVSLTLSGKVKKHSPATEAIINTALDLIEQRNNIRDRFEQLNEKSA